MLCLKAGAKVQKSGEKLEMRGERKPIFKII